MNEKNNIELSTEISFINAIIIFSTILLSFGLYHINDSGCIYFIISGIVLYIVAFILNNINIKKYKNKFYQIENLNKKYLKENNKLFEENEKLVNQLNIIEYDKPKLLNHINERKAGSELFPCKVVHRFTWTDYSLDTDDLAKSDYIDEIFTVCYLNPKKLIQRLAKDISKSKKTGFEKIWANDTKIVLQNLKQLKPQECKQYLIRKYPHFESFIKYSETKKIIRIWLCKTTKELNRYSKFEIKLIDELNGPKKGIHSYLLYRDILAEELKSQYLIDTDFAIFTKKQEKGNISVIIDFYPTINALIATEEKYIKQDVSKLYYCKIKQLFETRPDLFIQFYTFYKERI